MTDQIIEVAKQVSTGARADIPREFFIDQLEKRATESKQAGETREQAFARFATTTADGQCLLKASLRAKPAALMKAAPSVSGSAYAELAAQAAKLTADDPTLSLSTAMTMVLVDPKNAGLVAQDRADRRSVDKVWDRAAAFAKPGKPNTDDKKPALAALQSKAAELKAASPGLTIETAFARALADPANKALAQAERLERKTRGN